MPYSITTQDGITIQNIPDDIDPNSDVLRQRVTAIRGGQDAVVDSGAPSGNVSQPLLGDTATQEQQAILENAQNILQTTSPGFDPQGVPAGGEALGTIVSGAIAEPIAGVAGIVQAINPLAEAGAGARAVEATREALTLQPQTQLGRENLAGVAEVLAPVGEAISATEDFFGDAAFNITGSPAVATLFKTLPTAALEAIGGFGALSKSGGRLRKTGREALKVSEKQLTSALVESAPDIDTLKGASRAIYKEIDDSGIRVKPEAVNSMLKTVIRKARKEKVNPVLTPKSQAVVNLFSEELTTRAIRDVTDLDELRKTAQIAAASLDPSDARVGNLMIDEIDSFMDNVGSGAFTGAEGGAKVGAKYRAARKLWGRGRRAEIIQEAMDKAGRQASGFENGIRAQLRGILNNKKRSRFFSRSELAAMDDVVKGSNEQNILKLVGRLGFSEGQATNILGGLAGTAVFGPVTPLIGQASRALAQRSTRKAAALSDAIVKAGPDGKRIVEAYLKTIQPKNRSVAELSNLLIEGGANVDDLLKSADRATREAAELAKGRRAFISGAAAAGAAPGLIQPEAQ